MSERECRERYLNTAAPPLIIDAHCHLWLWQHTTVGGKRIEQRPNGRSAFLGREVQMMDPRMTDNRNSAEKLLATMDYAQVGGAIVTQEFIDGPQNDYLEYVGQRWPDRFFTFGMIEWRKPGFLIEAQVLARRGFRGIKLPAARLIDDTGRTRFDTEEFIDVFRLMEREGMILGIELAEGDAQCAELEAVIAECPRLTIVIGHFGMANRDGWMSQILLARHENVYIDLGGLTWLYNDEFYPYASAVGDLRRAADTVGCDRLLWGSDYPRTITAITYRQSYDWLLKATELTDDEKFAVLGLNARRVYGLTDTPTLPYTPNMSE